MMSGESDLEDLNGEERTCLLTETIVIVVVKKILKATYPQETSYHKSYS